MKTGFEEFSVWAPGARRVSLVMGKRKFSMNPEKRGCWRIAMPRGKDEIHYRFSMDGKSPIPDPRSRWQPDGIHGASCLPSRREAGRPAKKRRPFHPASLGEAVLYEMHVGTFTPEGTYQAAAKKLPHLAGLGITHIEMMPLATFPGKRGWGYDGVYPYAPHPAYGTPSDLKKFIAAAHRKKIAVILDVVYNHLGPDGNYLPRYGPYFTDRWKTPWGEAVNFDGPGSDRVRKFFFENAIMWLRDYGFDGLRLDAVHAIFDESAFHFLEELMARINQYAAREGREVFIVAESDRNDPRLVRHPDMGGYGLDAHWVDDFHHAIHAYFTGENQGYYADFGKLAQIAKALKQGYVYDGQYSPFRKRRHGRAPVGVHPLQLVVFNQNHDQIGNRAFGERLSNLLGIQKLKAVAAMTLLSPFIPLLFQGEEWGAETPFLYFTDHGDKKLGKLVTQGRRREFSAFDWEPGKIPDPQNERTFLASKLRWAAVKKQKHRELLHWYKALIRLRKMLSHDHADNRVTFDEEENWLILRNAGILAVFNLGDSPRKFRISEKKWKIALSSVGRVSLKDPFPALATVICTVRK